MKTCHECGCELRYYQSSARCNACYWLLAKVRGPAIRAVGRAVRRGELPNLKEQVVTCTDCDRRADRYDHRDYLKPLDVEPVCWWCNYRRGPAAPCLARAAA